MRKNVMLTILLVIAFLSATASAYGQINVPRKNIPSGLSVEAKQNIEALYSTDAETRAGAAFKLGQLNAAAAIPFLIAALDDGAAVSGQFCEVDNSYQAAPWGLDGEEGRACSPGQAATRAIIKIGEPAVEPLIHALNAAHWRARKNAAYALGVIGGERAVKPLVAAMKDEAWQVRTQATGSMIYVGNASTVKPLLEALEDDVWQVRSAAATSLRVKGDGRAVDALIDALKDEVWQVRAEAALALGFQGSGGRIFEYLYLSLQDTHPEVRNMAAVALAHRGYGSIAAPWIVSLTDERVGTRQIAANALGIIADPTAVKPLTDALQDSDEIVRKRARWALEEIRKGR